jgi:hypothetical protein
VGLPLRVAVPTEQQFLSSAGLRTEQAIVQFFRFREGRIAYAPGYRDMAGALEAAGLQE